jgi:hypothetical protein
MAFNFFGTANEAQFDDLENFSEIQRKDLLNRRQWLRTQIDRIGTYATLYDKATGEPLKFVPTPNSYADKLLQAYKILGGIPEQDFLLRSSTDPVFLTKGPPIDDSTTVAGGTSDMFSNKRRNRGGMRFDNQIGNLVVKMKNWQLEIIKRKREHLEYKIKRTLDVSDQMIKEIVQIDIILGDGRSSLDSLISRIRASMNDPANINTLKTGDRFGLSIGRVADLTFPNEILEQSQQHQRGAVKT